MKKNVEKQQVRFEIKEKISLLSDQEKICQSQAVFKNLFSFLPDFLSRIQVESPFFSVFCSLKDEVSTEDVIKTLFELGTVCLPRCNKDVLQFVKIKSLKDLEVRTFNIMEPKAGLEIIDDVNSFHVIIVPAIGFDVDCNRLGRGKGYYDKFLSNVGSKSLRIGLAFDVQIAGRIPCNKKDESVDIVVTATRIITNRRTFREDVAPEPL